MVRNGGYSPGFGTSDNTEVEFDNEVPSNMVSLRLDKISKVCGTLGDTHSTYVVGMGAQRKSLYNEIDTLTGASVIFCGSILPGVARLLSPLIASYAGLVGISHASALLPVFRLLTNRGMAGVYICPHSEVSAFEKSVTGHKSGDSYDYGLKDCPDYFFYVVDGDNLESSTGIMEIVSYGHQAPHELKL